MSDFNDRSLISSIHDGAYRLHGSPADFDPLIDQIGDAPSCCSARRRTARTSSIATRAEITKRLIAREGIHGGRGRGRLARRLPGQPLRARRSAATPTPRGAARVPPLSARGCGATPTCSISSAGCASHNDELAAERAEGRVLRARPLQPARLDGGRAGLPRRGRSRGRAPGARALRLLRALRRGPAGLRLRREPAVWHRSCERRGRRAARRAAAPRGRATRAATAAWPRTSSSSPSRTRDVVEERRAVLPRRCSAADLVVEPARPAHGRDARRARRSTSSGNGERRKGRRVGAQLAPRRRARDRDGRARRAERRPAVSRAAHGRDSSPGRLHHLRRAPSPRPPTGAAPPSASACGPALPGSYEALFHERRPAALPAGPARRPASRVGARASRASSARSA